MFYFIVLAFLLICAREGHAQCNGHTLLEQITFDDIRIAPDTPIGLPVPYYGFSFLKATSSGLSNLQVDLVNTTGSNYSTYTKATTTPDNLIFTGGEPLNLTVSDQKAFGLLNFSLGAIWTDWMAVSIQTSRNGNVMGLFNVTLRVNNPSWIVVNQLNIDALLVTALNGSFGSQHMGFDTFSVCH